MPAKRKHLQGFTLIEIMVVVAIIGVMASVIIVSLTRDLDRLARLEANQFLAIVNEVRDEAVIGGKSLAVLIDETAGSYRVVEYPKPSSDAKTDGLFKTYGIEAGIKLSVDIVEEIYQEEDADEDENEDKEQSDEKKVDNKKQIVCSPLGEITIFEIGFLGEEMLEKVYVDDDYSLKIKSESVDDY